MICSKIREGPSNTMTTPRKNPRKRLGLEKKTHSKEWEEYGCLNNLPLMS